MHVGISLQLGSHSICWLLHFLLTYLRMYLHTCVLFAEEYGHLSVDSQAVFANNEVSLKYIDTYGFDYDYTLACYTSHLPELLYRLCKERLVHASKVGGVRGRGLCYLHGCRSLVAAVLCHCVPILQYPEDILQFQYDPNFAIRGLHFDYHKVHT